MFGRLTLIAGLVTLSVTMLSSPCAARQNQLLNVDFKSALLTDFSGTPTYIHAEVLLPDDYYKDPQRRFPEIFWVPGFLASGRISLRTELEWQQPMRALHTEFIIVSLDGMVASGHQEFADSANNGPWGKAFTAEFIPETEAYFRTIGTPSTRFVVGHSSGGWSALWLQTNYPDIFGGCWAISPDPVDFRDFIGPDLTRSPPQNFYTDTRGNEYTVQRENGHDSMTLRNLVNKVAWGIWQYSSFDAVFSPQANGHPQSLFDRKTGTIDASVARYWEDHYDIDAILRTNWPQLGPKLRGKLHVFVGSEDTFHLDRPVRLMQAELQSLGSDAEIDFIAGADHWSVFDWKGGLRNYILAEMQARLVSASQDGSL